MKEFTVNASELSADVKLTCILTGTSPDYGTVYVDENMNLIHAPAEADANDTLHLENCILSVETPGNEYELDGNILSVVRQRLNGSVTAEAWVYTAAPERLVEFKYDSHGLRAQKKVTDHGQTVITDYIYHGHKLVGLTCGNDTLYFFYDAQGRPEQVECTGKTYTYIYSLSGNVTGIVDRSGNLIEEYQYDAWGRLLSTPDRLGQLNPFRYRGYVCADEIRMYYLKSRYYDQRYLRFICADIDLGAGSLLSNNIFSYCKNNPIMRVDANGRSSEWWFALRHPFVASHIGRYVEGKRCTNITTTAIRFAVSLKLKQPESANKEGTQVNALRHALWTGIISRFYGEKIAREAVRSHEDEEMLELGDSLVGKSVTEISAMVFSSHAEADSMCDMLNNEIALQMSWDKETPHEICSAMLDVYHSDGLWVIDENRRTGGFGIYKERLSDAQYRTAMLEMSCLDDYGFAIE